MLDPHAKFGARTLKLQALNAPEPTFGLDTKAVEHKKQGSKIKVVCSPQRPHHRKAISMSSFCIVLAQNNDLAGQEWVGGKVLFGLLFPHKQRARVLQAHF